MKKNLKLVLLVLLISGLSGCGESNVFTEGTQPTQNQAGTAVPAKLVIGTDKVAVKSDNSTSAAITATALDANNVVIAGATIIFTTPAGQLDASVVTTDATGKATVNFSAGAADPTNQTVTISADAGNGITASVPVQIIGSTVKFISSSLTQLTINGTDTATITLKAADASGKAVYNVPLTVSFDPASTATGQLDPAASKTQTYTANTDPNGEVVVDVKGMTAGNLVLSASSLGATATKTLSVVTATTALQITSPANLSTVAINTAQTVSITVPAGMTDVMLSTSLGQWGTVNGVAVNSATYRATGVAGSVINASISSSVTGTATIDVLDAANISVSDSLNIVFVNSTVTPTTNITLQASAASVPVSVGNTVYSVTLSGRVTDGGNGVASAPVNLSMLNQPGGGEYIAPTLVYSDGYGYFTTTFYSGSQGSDSNGVQIVATLLGNGKTTAVPIIISQMAASVVIGRSTVVSSLNSDTAYKLPMSVQVADANGSPVPNANVSISVWPTHYYLGEWAADKTAIFYGKFANEDVNRNLTLDPGEDRIYIEQGLGDFNLDGDAYDVVGGDGVMTPANTAAGTAPYAVTTDANGVGTFDLVYLKANAIWTDAEITATVQAQGTESTGVLTFKLPALISDREAGVLPDSPYNRITDASSSPFVIGMGAAGVGAMPSSDFVQLGSSATITVKVVDATLTPVNGAVVNLGFTKTGSFNVASPTVGATITTGADGTGTATYTPGDQAGEDVIFVQYNDGTKIHTNYVHIIVP